MSAAHTTVVRTMKKNEIPACAAIDRLCTMVDDPDLGLVPSPDAFSEGDIRASIRDGDVGYVVAIGPDETVVAYALFDKASEVNKVVRLCVHPDHRLQKYGSTLLNVLKGKCEATVPIQWPSASNFFKRRGLVGKFQRNAFGRGADGIAFDWEV